MKLRFIVLLVAVCTFLGLGVALAGPASAGTRTCDTWYTSTWGRVTQCSDGTPDAFEIDFSDFGAPDGMCVYLKGLADNNAGWYQADSSCTSTVEHVYLGGGFSDWKWVLFRGTSPTAWMTECNARDGNPAPVAGRPLCRLN